MQVDTNPAAETTAMESATPAAQTEVNATPAVENVTQEGTNAVAAPATPNAAPTEPVAPAYTPNFKFKIKDQEKEIDEMFRPLIKDPETEKKVKEFMEKAYGIDFVKEDRNTIKKEYSEFKTQIIPHLQVLDQFTTLRDKGQIGAALQVAGISDEQIFQYAIQKLEMEKNPHLAQAYQDSQAKSIRELELERELQTYKGQVAQTQEQAFYQELQQSFEPHKGIIEQVNAKAGSPEAFKNEVIAYGLMEMNRGNILTPAQATEAVVKKYQPFLSASSPVPPVQEQKPIPRPATIPNMGNSNVSPVRRQVSSVDDIIKLRNEVAG